MLANRNLIALILALLCFLIALLLATSTFISGGNEPAWIAGGLLLFTAAHLP